MRTYHATATVRNGQLVLTTPLPQELEGQEISLDLHQSQPPRRAIAQCGQSPTIAQRNSTGWASCRPHIRPKPAPRSHLSWRWTM